MFSNPLPDNEDYRVVVSSYAKRYYIKRFSKDYKARVWVATERSILEQLKRIHAVQRSAKVDELKRGSGCLLFKYDFAVAQTNVSPKASGNRCVVFLDSQTHIQTILLVYGKGDLPKNKAETQFIFQTISDEFNNLWERLN
ncbi:MAG: hypothetical protein ACR2FM_01530 [Candidatus Saccharimonadales bacterium]